MRIAQKQFDKSKNSGRINQVQVSHLRLFNWLIKLVFSELTVAGGCHRITLRRKGIIRNSYYHSISITIQNVSKCKSVKFRLTEALYLPMPIYTGL